MKPIITLTLNPAIDAACEADAIRPIRKIRTTNETYDPGGGGINVARVIVELGGEALAIYLAGGVTGAVLDSLVDERGVPRQAISIADHTRMSLVVIERSTGLEYRFVPEGPHIVETDWRAALQALETKNMDYIVASGSVPRGAPDDIYVRVAKIAAARNAKLALDSSGEALKSVLAHGGVYLVKPSLGEFEKVIGRPLPNSADQDDEALKLARSGKVEMVAVTMGRDGALLATRDGVRRLRAPAVEARSAVGAGDSFVAAMILALARAESADNAFTWGVAAGSAAVLHQGPGLCERANVERLYNLLKFG